MNNKIIDKESIEKYYISENHTFKQCLVHFSITNHKFYQLLHEYGLQKPTLKLFLSKHSEEEIRNRYIQEDLSFSDCVAYFNTTNDIFREALKHYKIEKSKDKYRNHIVVRDSIDKDSLYEFYIKQDNSIDSTIDHFNIRPCDLYYLLRKFDLRKVNKPLYEHIDNEYLNEYLNKEKLIDLYINKNLRVKDISKELRLPVTTINNFIKMYDIKKSKDLVSKLSSESKINKNGTAGNPAIFASYSDEFKALYHDKDMSEAFLDVKPRYKASYLANRFNCNKPAIYFWVNRLGLRHLIQTEASHYEADIVNFIKLLDPSINIRQHVRDILSTGKELDIYLPDYKLAIEFNGTYWHSTAVIDDKNYHIDKSKECEKLGIKLIHIYEYEWVDDKKRDLIKSLIKLNLNKIPNRIYARHCIIKEITNKEAKDFNEANHLQGHRNAQVTYGLYYKDTLVQLMSFSRTRYNRNLKGDNDWEIIRGCPGSLNLVIGGVSKLFKHFIRDYKPENIFSYCDFNKFDGISYVKLGMTFIGYTGPDKKYIIGDQVINRNPHNYSKYKDKIQCIIYGAGSKKFLWRANG